ncbi:MerR family transcriptional regulator [Planotetraspora phitsanulokensis]|uniref:HTH-type transcriptional activator TipA n=1 Tax=Planotetraspora phitsanulokensis TaxID=575192 RepID=A0A8J3UD40_9ACTN|nr:MerR family transcriptional regulator [Planotetraspora phitsanulokensis]GII43273.1 HTH-type transcriptional activator TipA [Planotetraspora phitsanulokensis]
MGYSVGQVAAFAGVTVRTLHHYDEIGLLSPGERTRAGYRRYAEPDLDRLQRILFYRELGFSLEEIATILDEPGSEPVTHLRRQHELLLRRIGRLQEMVAAVEKAMEAQTMGISLTPQERFEVFGDFDPDEHAQEAEERWGGTDAFEQSRRRTAAYTKEDWLKIQEEAGAVVRDFAAAFEGGVPADGAQAMDVAERHREHISRWFYNCSLEMHRGLSDMYVADPRFAANYEQVAEGLAAYIRDAVHANAERRS